MKKKICFVVAVPITAQAFLKDHIAALGEDYDIFLAVNASCKEELQGLQLKGWKPIGINRQISIWYDLRALWTLYRYFHENHFDAVHSVSPKAGLICALAAKMAGIHHRTHIFTGQVWATCHGVKRWLFKAIDKLIARLDNHIMVDGKSQRSFLIKEGVLKEGQAHVFCNGSIAGVNSERFVPDANIRHEERRKLGIKDGVITYLFLGRLNHDKGIGELYKAYQRLCSEFNDVFLLLVGFDEGDYIAQLSDYPNIQEGQNFHYYGIAKEPEKVLNAGDVFVLPTYREGFGSSVLEAACIGLPSICSDEYGVQDAFVEGKTGLRCQVGDSESLYQCMKLMHDHPERIREMGQLSRERALSDFDVKPITAEWVRFYHEHI